MRCITVMMGLLVFAMAAEIRSQPPITPAERAVTVELTRQRGVRLSWNKENRIVGATFKGVNASNQAVQLASQLPMLRALVLVAIADQSLTDAGLDALRGVPHLELLYIVGSDVTDNGIRKLAVLKSLRSLALKGNFGDAAIDVAAQLPNLEFLDLTQTRISSDGLAPLTKLPALQTLILNGTAVSSQGLAPLAQIKTLKWLFLGDTPIDDTAVVHLKQLGNLDELFVRGTRISADGVGILQAAMDSGCEIDHNSGTVRGIRKEPPGLAVAARLP